MFAIAIDGPSGAGKSTVAKLLAAKLGITYLDTGAMYRCVALAALRRGVSVTDEPRIRPILDGISIGFGAKDGVRTVLLNGEDVTAAIREHAVSDAASAVSTLACVREKMVELQRDIARRAPSVLDGRDIGTVVLPDADYKFFLTASAETRAKRRYDELIARGQDIAYADVLADMRKRDERDTTRANSPLRVADDAVVVDSTALDVDGVLATILGYLPRRDGGTK